jgi:multidrug efflux pump subunit AcrA (membrane-fusion protein)
MSSKKGQKFNKTQRGVERQFTDSKELERDFHRQSKREEGEIVAKKVTIVEEEDSQVERELKQEEEASMNRREREALQKQQAKERYQKLTEEGKTDQARSDLARLAIIRKQREDAKRKKDEEELAKKSKKQESMQAGKSIISKTLGKQK